MFGTNATPETIIEGWKLRAEIVKDMEALIRLTGPEWQSCMQSHQEEEEKAKLADRRKRLKEHGGGTASFLFQSEAPEIAFSRGVRRRYDLFFKLLFASDSSYRKLPDEMKPAFIEQLKRDFFRCSGMTNVNMKNYPPELKQAYMEVRKQMEAK